MYVCVCIDTFLMIFSLSHIGSSVILSCIKGEEGVYNFSLPLSLSVCIVNYKSMADAGLFRIRRTGRDEQKRTKKV